MRINITKTLSYIALGLWIIALVMVVGAFIIVRAKAPEPANTIAENAKTPTSAITTLVLATATTAPDDAPQTSTQIIPQGIPFPEGSLEHSFFPLSGLHAVIECESCHKDLEYAGTPTDCVSCHIETAPLDHFAGDCALCHAPTAWADAIFDHTVVNTSNCTACHSRPTNHYAGQCSNCHNTVDWRNVDFDHTGQTNCAACHNNNAPTNHYAGQCSNCHNTGNWSSVNFDHTGQTNCVACHSPPNNHFSGQCSNCHNTRDWDDADFDHAGQTNCLSCHKNDEPDEEDHPTGQQCSDCHNTNDWDDAEGDAPETTSVIFPTTLGPSHEQQETTSDTLSLEQLVKCSTCHENQ
jgi:hypothetical protein